MQISHPTCTVPSRPDKLKFINWHRPYLPKDGLPFLDDLNEILRHVILLKTLLIAVEWHNQPIHDHLVTTYAQNTVLLFNQVAKNICLLSEMLNSTSKARKRKRRAYLLGQFQMARDLTCENYLTFRIPT